MEQRKNKTLTHLLFSSYTIGFVLGGFTFFITETSMTISKEGIFSFILLLPIIYWIYRYSGMVFNEQSMKIKFLYAVLFLIGICFGVLFFWSMR